MISVCNMNIRRLIMIMMKVTIKDFEFRRKTKLAIVNGNDMRKIVGEVTKS